MCGHLDNAEEDLTKPIVSISFGNSVIFLIGGRNTSLFLLKFLNLLL